MPLSDDPERRPFRSDPFHPTDPRPVLRSAPGIESSSQESLKSKEDIYKIVVNTLAALIYPTRQHEFEPWTKMAQTQCASSACNEIVWGIRNHGESCAKCGYVII